ISTPIKFLWGYKRERATVYSPLPQASSSVIGFLLQKKSFHFPAIPAGNSSTLLKDLIALNLINFLCPIKEAKIHGKVMC
ncbi:MAG TPA: hypothetical protein VFN30_06180, partial [Chitinophagaceae bacterium]|nr:hypothetical protein [Chitinophagaceae bacterium]